MAKLYYDKLTALVSQTGIAGELEQVIEVRHFFSGAVLRVDDVACASWSPAGLAFKLSETEATDLISQGEGNPLKYFENGRYKKGYVVFEDPDAGDSQRWKPYFLKAAKQTQSLES